MRFTSGDVERKYRLSSALAAFFHYEKSNDGRMEGIKKAAIVSHKPPRGSGTARWRLNAGGAVSQLWQDYRRMRRNASGSL